MKNVKRIAVSSLVLSSLMLTTVTSSFAASPASSRQQMANDKQQAILAAQRAVDLHMSLNEADLKSNMIGTLRQNAARLSAQRGVRVDVSQAERQIESMSREQLLAQEQSKIQDYTTSTNLMFSNSIYAMRNNDASDAAWLLPFTVVFDLILLPFTFIGSLITGF